jgi:hypothetical protein
VDSGPQADGAPVAVGIARSRKAPTATWPRFGTRTRGSQSGADPRGRDPTRAGGRIRDPTSRASRRELRSAAGLEQGIPWEQAAAAGSGGGRSSGADRPRRRARLPPLPRRCLRVRPVQPRWYRQRGCGCTSQRPLRGRVTSGPVSGTSV